MKLIKTASGKQTIKISKKEWTDIGKKAGWMKKAQFANVQKEISEVQTISQSLYDGIEEGRIKLEIIAREVGSDTLGIGSVTKKINKEDARKLYRIYKTLKDRLQFWISPLNTIHDATNPQNISNDLSTDRADLTETTDF